jgi:L-threonylcarbamoyladenylate synthase
MFTYPEANTMETKIYTVTDPEKDKDIIEEAAEVIKNGGIVAFPTDTVYALGADVDNEEAVKKLFEVKNRPLDNPIGILVARDLDMHLCIDITAPNSNLATKLIENFWPGPLTIVMPRIMGRIDSIVTGGSRNVGVRQPDDAIAQALIYAVEKPIAAPSANISGHPSPTTAQHVIDDMNGKIDMILCGPDCKTGLESTIIDLSEDTPMIIRPGTITKEEIEEVIPKKVALVPQDISL